MFETWKSPVHIAQIVVNLARPVHFLLHSSTEFPRQVMSLMVDEKEEHSSDESTSAATSNNGEDI